ncbi:hypothetical protein M3Y99_00928800 [Aphelenchoides fujianensis]|nr:hypothetical protein M3Y99_00928800 [Aphelenchoides fujianensis]
MSDCTPRFGRIGVFVAVNSERKDKMYRVAQLSLQCYLKSTQYSYFYVDVDEDERTRGRCNQTNFYYKRHCVAAHYLKEVDWLLFLDGDIGVVNPDHCIEEWIDDRVDMIFYERFFNWEIMAGSYLMRNTERSRRFLMEWAETDGQQFDGFTGYDNGALQLQILKAALPEARAEQRACERIYRRSKTQAEYMLYVSCVRVHLGSVRVFPSVLRIYRRAHGWARDLVPSGNLWAPSDFMIHGWKANRLGEATVFNADVFKELPDPSKCSRGLDAWKWQADKRVGREELRQRLAQAERAFARAYPKVARDLPFLIEPDVADCFPHCEKRP